MNSSRKSIKDWVNFHFVSMQIDVGALELINYLVMGNLIIKQNKRNLV